MNRLTVCLALGGLLAMTVRGLSQEPQPGKQVEQSLEIPGQAAVGYLLYLPEDYDPQSDQKWPLMLFLHGRGESNGPLSLVAKWGPPQLVQRGENLPYILVSPQCPRDDRWADDNQQAAVLKLLDSVSERYRVDTQRIYLTGLSLGGFGSWRLAADHPQRFAAVVPICGGGNPQWAESLAPLPIWVWHGTEDRAVPYERSEAMVSAIREAGGQSVRFTSLEHVGHNCWSAAYATPELYQWLDQHRSSQNPSASTSGQ
jgi:predicted peptidase